MFAARLPEAVREGGERVRGGVDGGLPARAHGDAALSDARDADARAVPGQVHVRLRLAPRGGQGARARPVRRGQDASLAARARGCHWYGTVVYSYVVEHRVH